MICIIPARGGSKRLPRKNILTFRGEPIMARPIRAAIETGLFNQIIVSSDDDEILEVAAKCGAVGMKRPEHLATDGASELLAYRNVLEKVLPKDDFFCAIYPTAAFLTPDAIRGAFVLMQHGGYDVVMGVSKFKGAHPYQAIVLDGDNYRLKFPGLNEQVYPPAYASNGSVYWFRRQPFMKDPTYFPAKLGVFETQNVDINTWEDFSEAEQLAS